LDDEDLEEWQNMEFKSNKGILIRCFFSLEPLWLIQTKARGCSWVYGYKAAKNFLERNNLTTIVRGHSAQKYGYAGNFLFLTV